jgi:hypothetical protein
MMLEAESGFNRIFAMADQPRKATLRCPHCGTLNSLDLNRAAQGPKCGSCHNPILHDRPLKATTSDIERTIASAPEQDLEEI